MKVGGAHFDQGIVDSCWKYIKYGQVARPPRTRRSANPVL